MLCDKCHKNEATIHFTPVLDGKPQKTVDLCKDCAPEPRAKSLEAIYRRVTPEEFARLKSDAKTAESFFAPKNMEDLLAEVRHALEESVDPEGLLSPRKKQEGGHRYLFMGTDWHGLHFLLTGDSELKPRPLPVATLGKVVLGGTETTWPWTDGHVRALSADEVRAVAEALTRISVDELRSRFSSESFNKAQITPHPGLAFWTDEDAESMFEIYPRVVEFFQSAARDGDVILVSFD